MEVFTQFFRRAVSSNAPAIFSGARDYDHGSLKLLQEELDKVPRDPEQASKIAEAIDSSRDDIFRDFDLSTFITHFYEEPVPQTLLAIAFTRCNRADLRHKADKFLSTVAVSCLRQVSQMRFQIQSYHPRNISTLVEYCAFSTVLSTQKQKEELLWAIITRYDTLQSDPPSDVVPALLLLKSPAENQKIARAFFKAGSKSTSSKQTVEDILHAIGLMNVNEDEILQVLLLMAMSQSQSYDLTTFVDTIQGKSQTLSIDWSTVLSKLDIPSLRIPPDGFLKMFKALRQVAVDDPHFDLQKLWGGTWQDSQTQMSFVYGFLTSPVEDVGPARIPGFRAAFQPQEVEALSGEAKQYLQKVFDTQYASLDALSAVFDILLSPDMTAQDPEKTQILNIIYQEHPVVFLFSLPKLKPKPWSQMQEKFVYECFRQLLEKQRDDSELVLQALYASDPQSVFDLCAMVFQQDPRQTGMIYERAIESGWFDDFLEHWSNPLALDMACMRNKLDSEFDLDRYLSDIADGSRHAQLGVILGKYVRIKANDEFRVQREHSPPQSVPLNLATVHTLLEKLEEVTEDRRTVEDAQTTCLTTYPRLMNYGSDFDRILEQSSEEKGNKLSATTDTQMSELFGQMYRSELSIRDMVNEMRRLKTSTDPGQQDLFCCIVHGLFDEYMCYSEYPEDALQKTALLFGNIIKYKLLPSIPRDFGLVLILRAVRDHAPDTLMNQFGIEALLQISDQLPEWPGLCSLLLRIPTLQNPEILQKAQEALESQQASGEVNGDGPLQHVNGHSDDFLNLEMSTPVFRSVHKESASSKHNFQEPDGATQEKILFVINNLSKDNMSTKLPDLTSSLLPEHFQWFAAYLVEQRAKLEPNNQDMYFGLIDTLDEKLLTAEVLRETYCSIHKMLNSESTIHSTIERTHLKNLGEWLGKLTLARDQPVKHKNIYFVDLLVEGYDNSKLPAVIPFTCKVLDQGGSSTLFKPPNPWLMEILQLLKELYEYAELKLNLKFEIEVLCKALKQDMRKLEASSIIRDRSRPEDEIPHLPVLPDGMETFDDLSLNGAMSRGVRERLSAADIMATLPNLADVIKVPPTSGNAAEQSVIRDIIYRAFDQAIQEIIAPVVERSITIASISTAQLMSKDYALNPDPEQYQLAARQMVKSLAGSLALVTCKEPLRMSITNWIRRPHEDVQEPVMPEGAILMCVNDNLDKACSFVERAAVERAIPEIDAVISSEIEDRKRFIEQNNGQEFRSATSNANRWSSWIPEPYKLNLGGLTESQRAVYEEFEQRVSGTNIGHTQNASMDSTGRQIPDVLQETLAMPNLSTPAEHHVLPHQSPLAQQDARLLAGMPQSRINGVSDTMPPHERISLLIEDVQKSAQASDAKRLKDLEKNSSIFQDFRQILIVLTSSTRPTADLLARQITEKICNIFATKPPDDALEAEVLALLLQKLCQLSELIVRDVLRWMTVNEPHLMASSNVVGALVSATLMDFNRVDTAIANILNAREPHGLQLLSDLMDQTLFVDEPQALRADFANSLVSMSMWLKEDNTLQLALNINQKLRAHGMPEFVTVAVSDKVKAKHDQMRYIFDEWVGMFENLEPDVSSTGAFLKDLHKGQIINGTDDLADFLRGAIDLCIEAFEREAQSIRGSVDSAFLPTDALARLVVMLVVFQGETNGAVQLSKAPYLDTILSVLVLIVNHHQNMHGVGFHQRIFHRLFSSILYEYSSAEGELAGDHNEITLAFGNTLKSLQPAWFPSFAYSWINLICHRVVLGGMLRPGNDAGHVAYRDLIGLALLFISQAVRLPNAGQIFVELYRAMQRNMMVIHHDYPEFVCSNYTYFCSRVAYHTPQIRNLILTSRPAAVLDLPDPMTPGLKVERLEEMKKNPELPSNFDTILMAEDLIESVDSALRKNGDIDGSIKTINAALTEEAETATFVAPKKSVEILNSLVPYIAQQTLSTGARFDAASQAVTFFTKLATSLGYKHRYYLVNALVDQIRYPNTFTDFFCKYLLHLWGQGNIPDTQRELREPICRVVYERLIVARPHPWGITILSLELQQNQQYGFWDVISNESSMHQRLQHAMRNG